MTVDEFLRWSAVQERGRYELQDGRVIMQQSQTWSHAETKALVFNALVKAIAKVKLPYFAAPDGMTVRIDEHIAFEPDALVAPLPKPAADALEVNNPVIVVEVLSPTSVKRDAIDKLASYFRVPSIAHYLIVDPETRKILHHQRATAGLKKPIELGQSDTLRLDPPGFEVPVTEFFPTPT